MANIHQAIDRQIGAIRAACPDAVMIVFNLHGMGRNGSDVASMVLLPELLFRRAFGKPKLKPGSWPVTRSGVPLLADGEDWHRTMRRLMPSPSRSAAGFVDVLARTLRRNGPGMLPSMVRRLVTKDCEDGLGWMPATRYAGYWPLMDVFALPSFYDGRLRVSLAGREANGSVSPVQYGSCLDEIEECLRACTNPLTGKPVIATIRRPGASDPLALHATDADMIITWADGPLGFDHPAHGLIGPLPFRRPGGHAGRYGAAYINGPGIPARDCALTSAFNVVPTAIALTGRPLPADLSGADLGVAVAS